MIISQRVSISELTEIAESGQSVIDFVEQHIRPQDRGIKFVEDNQYYYCAIIIHSCARMPFYRKRNVIEGLVKGRCAFGATNTFTTLREIIQYADKPVLINLLRKEIQQ